MDDAGLVKVVRQICAKDKRYHPGAYFFVMEALEHTARLLDKHAKEGVERHVSGKELLEGIRAFSLQQFGPMALTVFDAWGVATTRDFGAIVFNLVETGKLRKTETDSIEEFDNVFDFRDVFEKPFLPKSELPGRRTSPGSGQGRRGRHGGAGKKPGPVAK